MTTYSLTKRQQDALDFITNEIRSKGISPSYEEIGKALSLKSKSGVHRLISGLIERGHLKKFGARARTLTLPNQSKHFTSSKALYQAEKALGEALTCKTGWAVKVEQALGLIKEARTK